MDIPRVTSDVEARHEGHVLAAFGAMGMPHMQHRMLTVDGFGLGGSDGCMGACILLKIL